MAAKDDYQDFKVALNDLKLNSKPLINFLTILAEEKMHNAPQIVRAIEERIVEVCIKKNYLSFRTLRLFFFSRKVIMFYLLYMFLIQS
jgi:hypothetical protein